MLNNFEPRSDPGLFFVSGCNEGVQRRGVTSENCNETDGDNPVGLGFDPACLVALVAVF